MKEDRSIPVMAQDRKRESKLSRLAILSVVLGAAGLLTAGMTALLGLVLGLGCVVRIALSRGRLRGQMFAVMGILVSAGVGVVTIFALHGG